MKDGKLGSLALISNEHDLEDLMSYWHLVKDLLLSYGLCFYNDDNACLITLLVIFKFGGKRVSTL